MVTELSDENFETEVLQSPEPVLVDFWGPGCPPCQSIAPIIKELAEENAGSAKVAKINVAALVQIGRQAWATRQPFAGKVDQMR